jgi:hypothetical protein
LKGVTPVLGNKLMDSQDRNDTNASTLLNAFLLFKYYLKNKSFPKREAVALSLF